MNVSREAVYSALFALIPTVAWNGLNGASQFSHTSRRVVLFSGIPADGWPACCQAEYGEDRIGKTGLPSKTTLGAVWMIYHNVSNDRDVIGSTESNAILDALDVLFPNENDDYLMQTLGGLVTKVVIQGKVMKEHGDLNGQALLLVPLKIFVP